MSHAHVLLGVTREGAELLVKKMVPMRTIGDHMFSQLVTYSSSPRLFEQAKETIGSTIQNDKINQECKQHFG